MCVLRFSIEKVGHGTEGYLKSVTQLAMRKSSFFFFYQHHLVFRRKVVTRRHIESDNDKRLSFEQRRKTSDLHSLIEVILFVSSANRNSTNRNCCFTVKKTAPSRDVHMREGDLCSRFRKKSFIFRVARWPARRGSKPAKSRRSFRRVFNIRGWSLKRGVH